MSQSQQYPEWFRMACVIYGSHVSTTLVPIIGTFITSEEMTIKQKCATTASKYAKERGWFRYENVRYLVDTFVGRFPRACFLNLEGIVFL